MFTVPSIPRCFMSSDQVFLLNVASVYPTQRTFQYCPPILSVPWVKYVADSLWNQQIGLVRKLKVQAEPFISDTGEMTPPSYQPVYTFLAHEERYCWFELANKGAFIVHQTFMLNPDLPGKTAVSAYLRARTLHNVCLTLVGFSRRHYNTVCPHQ